MSVTNFTLADFNAIRNDPLSGLSYLPEATVTNISTIKTILDTDPKAYNAYVSGMLVRIGDVIVKSPGFVDPFEKFYKSNNDMKHLVQEIHIDPIVAEGEFDGKGLNPLGRRTNNNTHVAYHNTNYQPIFALTVDRVGLMDAFASWDMLDLYWGEQMKAMYTGESIGRFNAELKVIADACKATGDKVQLPSAYMGQIIPKDEASGKAFCQALKYIVNDMILPNNLTQAGTVARADKSDLIILLNKDVEPNLDVYTLASLFNAEMADIQQRIVTVPSFALDSDGSDTANKDVLGIITTTDWLQFRRTMYQVRRQENAQGLFDNYFLHSWASLQLSPFAPCVVLRRGDSA